MYHPHILFCLPAVLLSFLAVIPTVNAAPVANITKRAPAWGFPYGSTKVRGVNLGGWLVLEVSGQMKLYLGFSDV
jgi:glucan 1,3-beta-glucosidase